MPSRVIRGESNRSETLNSVSMAAELTFRKLVNATDDYGRLDARPANLLAELYPLRRDVDDSDVETWIGELVREGAVLLYEHRGTPYLWLTTWELHRGRQKRAGESKCPDPSRADIDRVMRVLGIDDPEKMLVRMGLDELDEKQIGYHRPLARLVALICGDSPDVPGEVRGGPGHPRVPDRGDEVTRCRGDEEKKEVAPAGAPPDQAVTEAINRVEDLRRAINDSIPGQVPGLTEKKRDEWARELQLLHTRGSPGGNAGDGFTWNEIDAVIAWLPTHRGSGDFTWGKNIRSPKKLRQQFPRLLVDMRARPGPKKARGNVNLDAWEQHEAMESRGPA